MQQFTNYTRYLFILIAVIAVSEYAVMMIFDITGLGDSLSQETEALLDSLLLLILSAAPVYFFIIKPIVKLSLEYQEEQTLLVEALDGASDIVIITDVKGDITYVNRAFTTITGYSPDEAIGNNPRFLQSGKQDKDFYTMMWKTITTTGEWSGEL